MKLAFESATSFDLKKQKRAKGAAIAIAVTDALKLEGQAAALDKLSGGLIKTAMSAAKFSGKSGQVTRVVAPKDVPYDQILIVGIGDGKKTNYIDWEKVGGTLLGKANAMAITKLCVLLDVIPGKKQKKGEAPAHVALGSELAAYDFDKYHTTRKEEQKPTLKSISVITEEDTQASKHYKTLEAIRDGVFLTRNVVTEPGNVIYPETLAAECKKLEKDGVKVTILGEKEMTKLGMGALLGVGQGSIRESKLAIMEWNGGKKGEKPVAFIGKGVTFDTGGISIKPSNGMEEMKFDMGGAGTVIGLMKTLAGRKAKTNVVGLVGLVENMPDGNAQRPGDVVTSMSGQTIEVLNTDAEGRLVLADVLWYAKETYKPKFMINLATLTGAIIVALGHKKAGIFSNDDTLCEQLTTIGDELEEEVWRLPIGDYYDKLIDSDIADMQNIGANREAGSITAGQFLHRFVGKVPWVHIDIAGTAWRSKAAPTTPKGATAFGVRLLNALVARHYE